MAREPLGHGLRELLGECLAPEVRGRLVLLRSKFKPGRKLTAHYRFTASSGGEERDLTVTWSAVPGLGRAQVPETSSSDGTARGTFFKLTGASADGSVAIRVSPSDALMPELARLHRRSHLARVLARLSGGPPSVASMRITTIRYRPGERHVLAVEREGIGNRSFIKIDRDASGERAVPLAGLLRATLEAAGTAATVAEPLGYVPADRAAVWRGVRGIALARQLVGDGDDALSTLAIIGRAIRAIHDDDRSLPFVSHGRSARDPRTEVDATLRAGEYIAAIRPDAAARFRRLVDAVDAGLAEIPGEPPTLIHGDLKADNVMVRDDGVTLLDLDRASPGDPALDLGKFIADLRWWLPGRTRAVDSLIAAFRSAYGPCDDDRWTRARLLANLAQLKLAARRCAVHDPRWGTAIDARIAEAANAMLRVRRR